MELFKKMVVSNLYSVISEREERHSDKFKKHIKYENILQSYELYYLNAEALVTFNDQKLHMKEGFVTFLPKGTVSTYCIDKIKPGTFVDIYFDTASPLPNEAMTFDLSANKTIKALFDKLYILWIMRDNNSHLRCYNLFYQILLELTEFSNAPSYTALRQREKIKPAVSYMEQYCFDKDFDYDKLPELCGISYSYFKRIFISVYNMPPSKYITHIRLAQAKEMLKSGQYSINAIADMVGYSEASYFSRIFKENIGCSPLHYKNKS